MASSSASARFQRFESARDRMGDRPGVARRERWSSPHTHPGMSLGRMAVVKARVLAMFLVRRLAQGPGRRRALRPLRLLHRSATGKTLLVIGSGPSAAKLSAPAVAKQQESGHLVVVATNHFLSSPLAQLISPDFLVWSDDTFKPDRDHHDRTAWERLRGAPPLTLVCPWTWRKAVESLGLPHRVVYFDDDSLEGWSRNISPLRPRGYQGTTGVKALAVALHLGGSPVKVIGLDLSYFRNFTVDAANTITRHPTHLAGTDSGSQTLNSATLLGMADLLYSAANQFRVLHTHFGRHPIVNLDPDSLVDAFPKEASSALLEGR